MGGDGKFVRSFLSDHEYKKYIKDILADEKFYFPQGLQDVYTNVYELPDKEGSSRRTGGTVEEELSQSLVDTWKASKIGSELSQLELSVLIPVVTALALIVLGLCGLGIYFYKRKTAKKEDFFEDAMLREAMLIQNGLCGNSYQTMQ